MKPRLLDLFCGAGGCTKGYQRAGFEVFGIDLHPQWNYCGEEFVQMDALRVLEALVAGSGFAGMGLDDFTAIHASPPCQGETSLKHLQKGKEYPDLIDPVRGLLEQTGKPYVIENVPGAAAKLRNPLVLCGSSFGLGIDGRELRRHRLFECSFPVMAPPCQHSGDVVGVYGTGGGGQMTRGYKAKPGEDGEALGIDWMTRAELAQAIPPAYTEFVGGYLMAEVARVSA